MKNFKRKKVVEEVEDYSEVFWKHSFVSPLGRIELISSVDGVCSISLPGGKTRIEEVTPSHADEATIRSGGAGNRAAAKQLNEYFRGKRRSFDFDIDLRKTGFYRKALTEGVMRIPYGETRSYGQIAKDVGSPRAARAVGTANATNPLPFVIPCHRVVACNGIGGYGGGLNMKRTLLKLESDYLSKI